MNVEERAHIYSMSKRKHRVWLSLIANVVGILTAAITMAFVLPKTFKEKQPVNYDSQVAALDTTKQNLEGLLEFVAQERERVVASQQALDVIKAERDRLQPLLDLDRKAIDAVMLAQETRNAENIGKERWIGFGFGVASSLLASLIWYFVARMLGEQRRMPRGW